MLEKKGITMKSAIYRREKNPNNPTFIACRSWTSTKKPFEKVQIRKRKIELNTE